MVFERADDGWYAGRMTTTLLIVVGIVIAVGLLWSVWGSFSSRVEQAEYRVVATTREYEIRAYAPHVEAQTTVRGTTGEALNRGFGIIAGYIFGGNATRSRIAMTAPVKATSERIAMTAPVTATAQGDSRVIAFVMPRSYTMDTLPKPNDDRVHLVAVPARTYAALRFSGWRSDTRLQRMQERLLASLARDRIRTVGTPMYAGYNAPWTPPWMTRNEVLVEIAQP